VDHRRIEQGAFVADVVCAMLAKIYPASSDSAKGRYNPPTDWRYQGLASARPQVRFRGETDIDQQNRLGLSK
jgi:hypothetical protein